MKKQNMYKNLVNSEVQDELQNNWLIIPTGSVEQHGVNLPLSVDSDIVVRIAEQIVEEKGGILAPQINYGARSLPNSGGGDFFMGNVYLDGETYIRMVYSILKNFIRNGARRILVFNGHYENYTYLCEASQLADSRHICNIVVMNWWDILDDGFMKEITEGRFKNWEGEHAGLVETALEMYLYPSKLKGKMYKETANEYKNIYSSHIDCVKSRTGSLSSNTGATNKMGYLLFQKIKKETEKLMDAFCQMEREDEDGTV